MAADDVYRLPMSQAHSNELMQIYLLVGEEQSGPFAIDQIRGLWNQAAITSDAYYWHEGLENWEPLVVLMTESSPADHAAESGEVAATLASDNKEGGAGIILQAVETSGQTKKERKQARKAMVAALAEKAGRPEPSRLDRAGSDNSSAHSFGPDGKCARCGSTRGAVEHFGFPCNTFDSKAARGRLEASRAASSKTRQSVQRSSHLPYCSRCRCHVNPNVVSRNRAGPGAAFAVGDNYVFAQRSTSELIKVCPKCGERVYAAAEIAEFQRKSESDNFWVWVNVWLWAAILLFFGGLIIYAYATDK